MSGALLSAITIALAFIAIRRSPKKIQTTSYIVAVILACGTLGMGIGFALANSSAAGLLAALFMQVGGIAVSIGRMRRYKKRLV